MKVYTLRFKQELPIPLEEAWDFFSSPQNLGKITPSMGFQITSQLDKRQTMYPGILISYKITPLLGIKMDWLTEITHIAHHKYFVDEQRFGPFAMWHHQHHFRSIKRGIEMTDILNYAIPFGLIGRIANNWFVKDRIMEIFEYRRMKIDELFGSY